MPFLSQATGPIRKVKIKKASHPNYWYADCIGETYNVVDEGGPNFKRINGATTNQDSWYGVYLIDRKDAKLL
jgi:hypothetical protein